jgi:thiol:disulfide interchange protein
MHPVVFPAAAAYCTSASNTYRGSPPASAAAPPAAPAPEADAAAPTVNSVAWYAAAAEARAVENTVRRDTQMSKATKTTSHRHLDQTGDAAPFAILFDDVCTTSSLGPAIAFISFLLLLLLLLWPCVLVFGSEVNEC